MSIFIFHRRLPKKLAIFENTAGTFEMAALPNFHIPAAATLSPRPTDLAALLILPTLQGDPSSLKLHYLLINGVALTIPVDPDDDEGAESAPY